MRVGGGGGRRKGRGEERNESAVRRRGEGLDRDEIEIMREKGMRSRECEGCDHDTKRDE